MKYVYTISPDYLKYLIEDSKDYTFDIIGYRNFDLAIQGLSKVNTRDIYGFIYFSDHRPFNRNKALQFLRYCDSLCSRERKHFIFFISNINERQEFMAEIKRYEFLTQIHFININEDVSDTLVRKVFGALITIQEQGWYDIPSTSKKGADKFFGKDTKTRALKTKSIIPLKYLATISPVNTNIDYNLVIKNDNYLFKLYTLDKILYKLRLAFINASYGKVPILPEVLKPSEEYTETYMILKCIENIIWEVYNEETRKV